MLGLAPSCPNGDRFTGDLGVLTVNIPVGWSAGLAPACSRFTASCLDCFDIDHSPPGRNRTFTSRLSGECTSCRATGGSELVRARAENSPSNGQIRSSGCHTTAARFLRGGSGEAGCQRIERCYSDLESKFVPDGNLEFRSDQTVYPRGFEPLPTAFALPCPILGTNTWSG